MKLHPFLRPTLPLLAVLVISACGGGGGSSLPPSSPVAMVNVALTDAPSKDFDHVWITVSEIRFHTSNNAAANDPGWLKFPLGVPASIDLATLYNGTLSALFNNLALPAGTYQQIRLMLVDDAAPLANSAVAAGLTYNDQVNWTDPAGTSHVARLEIPSPSQGIALNGTFAAVDGGSLNLVLDFDVGHDVVRFLHAGNTAFTLLPHLQYFDLAESGAVSGQVDASHLCSSSATSAPSGCAYNLVIKAEVPSADGSYHQVARSTTIRSDGSFTLFPLRIPAGASSTNVDVLVRGRNMDTVVVRNVPVAAATTPSNNPGMVSSNPLPITIDGEYTANAATPLSPTGAWVDFYQTLSATGQNEAPYEVRTQRVNPFTGKFLTDFALSTGPIWIGNYVAGGSPVLVANTPTQGLGAYSVVATALDYTRTVANATLTIPSAGPALFSIPTMPVNPAVASADSISGTISQATAGTYDSGFLVVVRMGAIVQTIPIATQLGAAGGTGSAYTVNNLPGGGASLTLPGAYYYLYARVWNSADPIKTLRRIDFSGYADLRAGSATGMNVTLN